MGSGVRRNEFSGSRENAIMALAQSMKGNDAPEQKEIESNKLWTNVKDKLPSEKEIIRMDGKFLVSTTAGKVSIASYTGLGDSFPRDVVAWMNLPEAYVIV